MNARMRQLDEAIAGASGADPETARRQAVEDEMAREKARRAEEEAKRKKGDSRSYWSDMIKRMMS